MQWKNGHVFLRYRTVFELIHQEYFCSTLFTIIILLWRIRKHTQSFPFSTLCSFCHDTLFHFKELIFLYSTALKETGIKENKFLSNFLLTMWWLQLLFFIYEHTTTASTKTWTSNTKACIMHFQVMNSLHRRSWFSSPSFHLTPHFMLRVKWVSNTYTKYDPRI